MRARTLQRAKCRAEGAIYERQAGGRKPFRRIGELVARVNVTAPGTADFAKAMGELQAYRSRGHGKGGHVRHRVNFEDRSKYVPAECFARGCR